MSTLSEVSWSTDSVAPAVRLDAYRNFIGDVLQEPNTLCEFHISATEGGTKVRLVESGFASLPAEFYEDALSQNQGGWDVMVHRLKTFVETGTAVSPSK